MREKEKNNRKYYIDLSLRSAGTVRFSSFCSLILSLWPGWFGKAEPRTYRAVAPRKNGKVEKPAR